MSSTELSRELNLRQYTAWAFKRKIQQAMQSSEKFPLEGEVEVDEFVIGGPEEGKPGRSKGNKKIVVLAIERPDQDSIGRAYAVSIKDYSSKEIGKIFDKHIHKNATIVADGWSAYDKLAKDWDIYYEPSDKGKGFPKLHIMIMNFKAWLRGIHHKCDDVHMQGYLNEYFYRFNRRNFNSTVFHKLIDRMINHKPYYYKAFSG
jgi:transposase-like protein